MTFISYAQNFEDVMLHRALMGVVNGFYIDVGASDPVLDSVTKAFYELGWTGINIEPEPEVFRKLCEDRKRDINLRVAIGDHAGSGTLFDLSVRGHATLDGEAAEEKRASGRSVVAHEVQVRTLADVCSEHVRGDIHFLKIDVEGWERQVLAGMDFGRFRPWIIVVEAVKPGSAIKSHADWEALLTQGNYLFAFFDGLNRYYVAAEHRELEAAFTSPPNVFDDAVKFREIAVQQELSRIGEIVAAKEAELRQSRETVAAKEAELRQSRETVAAKEDGLRQSRETVAAQETERRRTPERRRTRASVAAQAELSRTRETVAAQETDLGRIRETVAAQEADLSRTRKAVAAQEADLSQTRETIETLEALIADLQSQLQAVYSSTSWRMTRPLRWAKSTVQRTATKLPRPSLRNRIQLQLRRLVVRAADVVSRNEVIRRNAISLIRAFPGLELRLRALISASRSRAFRHAPMSEHLSGAWHQSEDAAELGEEFVFPLPAGQRTLYVFVDHTVVCPTNTGMQRVARALASPFLPRGGEG